jgi:omega-6 fatty acid desaturase (delta-12 desaturase)
MAASRAPASQVEVGKAPTRVPPFTLADVRRAIPAHCFKRSLLISSIYLLVNVAICAALAFGATWIEHPAVPAAARWLLWPLYWFFQVQMPAR